MRPLGRSSARPNVDQVSFRAAHISMRLPSGSRMTSFVAAIPGTTRTVQDGDALVPESIRKCVDDVLGAHRDSQMGEPIWLASGWGHRQWDRVCLHRFEASAIGKAKKARFEALGRVHVVRRSGCTEVGCVEAFAALEIVGPKRDMVYVHESPPHVEPQRLRASRKCARTRTRRIQNQSSSATPVPSRMTPKAFARVPKPMTSKTNAATMSTTLVRWYFKCTSTGSLIRTSLSSQRYAYEARQQAALVTFLDCAKPMTERIGTKRYGDVARASAPRIGSGFLALVG